MYVLHLATHSSINPEIQWGHGVEYIIPPSAVKAGKHEIVIESSCNGMFGVPWNGDTIAPPDVSSTPVSLLFHSWML